MKEVTIVKIVGTMNCRICGGEMTQADIDNQEAILTGNNPAVMNIIAHLRHFYIKEKNFLPTDDYELNMAKLAFAVGEENGWLNQPAHRQRALNEIADLEKKFQRKVNDAGTEHIN